MQIIKLEMILTIIFIIALIVMVYHTSWAGIYYEILVFLELTNPHVLTDRTRKSVRKALTPFVEKANKILKEQNIILEELESKGITGFQQRAIHMTKVTKAKWRYNDKLENTLAYRKIATWVEEEACRQYVESQIGSNVRWQLNIDLEDDEKKKLEELAREQDEKIEKAKHLIKTNPKAAADLFHKIGTCHILWGLENHILEEQLGVIKFSPAELSPDIIFD